MTRSATFDPLARASRRVGIRHVALLAVCLFCAQTGQAATAAPPHAAGSPYAAKSLPDRILLSPGGDAAHEMSVAFRTDTAQPTAEAELALALDGPALGQITPVKGTSVRLATGNGDAVYHQIRFTGLLPATSYVYRVKGAAGWSEWLQFRTAADTFQPFRFLYFGDTQNDILSIASRVIRQAFHATTSPALVLHGGDLMAQRNQMVYDDEWGEWTAAGGYNYSTVPQIPAAGNHEYTDTPLPGGDHGQVSAQWRANFALPGNGAEPVKATTYYVDYQQVRFVVLDGTAALEHGALKAESEWLERVLSNKTSQWTVVMFHQPLFMCARPNDLEELKNAWKPILEKHHVDLVLSGHDHCYSRISNPAGKAAAAQAHAAGAPQGPVYVISVTGSKMYALNPRTQTQPDRVAEDTELYQVVDLEKDRLRFRAYGATGRLYDAFDLVRGADGSNRLVEADLPLGPLRVCTENKGPDGLPCTSRSK